MPISWGTAEYEYYHFAMMRDAYFHRNAFIVNDEFVLEPGDKYSFSNKSNCRASFYMYFISSTHTNALLAITGYSQNETRTIVPNQLFAPYRQHIFDEPTDLEHLHVENPNEYSIDLVLLFIPIQSIFIREIVSAQQVWFGSGALIAHTGDVHSFSFQGGVMQIGHSAHVIFSQDTFVSTLKVHVSRNNDISLLNKSGLVIPMLGPAQYIDGCICIEYADHGLYGNCYDVMVTSCAVRAEVLHVISTDQSAQIVLLDENGRKAQNPKVLVVTTSTQGAQITSYFMSDGIIHLRGVGPSYLVDIELSTDTGMKKLCAEVTPQLQEFVVGAAPPPPAYH